VFSIGSRAWKLGGNKSPRAARIRAAKRATLVRACGRAALGRRRWCDGAIGCRPAFACGARCNGAGAQARAGLSPRVKTTIVREVGRSKKRREPSVPATFGRSLQPAVGTLPSKNRFPVGHKGERERPGGRRWGREIRTETKFGKTRKGVRMWESAGGAMDRYVERVRVCVCVCVYASEGNEDGEKERNWFLARSRCDRVWVSG